MTNISQAFAFSFSYNLNNQNNNGFQNGAYMPTGQDPMASMMMGFGLMFAGMDMIDNGQIDGSIFQMLAGGTQQAQGQFMPMQFNPQQNSGGLTQAQQSEKMLDGMVAQKMGVAPYPGLARSQGINSPQDLYMLDQNRNQQNPQQNQFMPQQNQNPMMQFMMQMMAMLFGMMDIMDDGQINGSIFQQLLQGLQGNQNQQSYNPYNQGYNNSYNNGLGWDPLGEMNKIMNNNYQGYNNANSPSNWLYRNSNGAYANATAGSNGASASAGAYNNQAANINDNDIPISSGGMARPADGRVTSNFGWRTHPVHGGQRFHKGMDIAAPQGSAVRSAMDGVVSRVGNDPGGYGNFIYVRHKTADGRTIETRYAHLSGQNVQVGQQVAKGQRIGSVGSTGCSTGPHLHFEVRDSNGNAMDPRKFL